MTYESYNEDRVRLRELHSFLAKEEREVRRAEAIEARADELLKEEYYPLDPENLSEVIQEMSVDQVKAIAVYLSNTQKGGFRFQMNNEMVCRMMWVYSEHYWRKCAINKAEKEIDNEN